MSKFAGRVALLLLALLTAPAFAQGAGRDIAARTELHPIPTLTLPDSQFLAGAGGTPVTVAGQFRIAQGEGRLPVVVLVHGSGGPGSTLEQWSRDLNAIGVSTFAIDGFSARGLVTTSENQSVLGTLNMIIDVYRALEILAQHQRVDPARIAVMGFSRGGRIALYAGMKRFHGLWNRSELRPAAYLAFYPSCNAAYAGDTDVEDAPIRIFHGAADDYVPPDACRAYVKRLKDAGRDAAIIEYDGAGHAFDSPLGRSSFAPRVQVFRDCAMHEENGVILNSGTGKPFIYEDACVKRGAHVGGNPRAAAAARADVKRFAADVFGLKPD